MNALPVDNNGDAVTFLFYFVAHLVAREVHGVEASLS